MGDVSAMGQYRAQSVMLGSMLNSARLRRGWRLGEAARLLGVSSSYLLDVEAGVCRPSRAVAELLAEAFQLNDTERAQLLHINPSLHAA
ncbi:MAG: helix-turn-helix transcriptional regulator [Streptomycetaceae bacterium]|nr:helix-turn-helix transcriptional regulator [Streptomycetaceae bacterium]